MPDSHHTNPGIVTAIDEAGKRFAAVREAIGEIIFGQEETIALTLTALLAGGHALLVGAPGLAKTRLAGILGHILGLSEKRIQFTPDLMPADILGSEILEETTDVSGSRGKRHFRFIQGPVFCRLLMADEINRASPRTQAALLQAMQERHVSVAGVRYDLPEPFHVLATENPIEQDGTYPLPEAQLDRFLFQINVPYPSLEAERRMLFATTGPNESSAPAILTAQDFLDYQKLVRMVPVSDQLVDAILKIVRAARPGDDAADFINHNIAWGPSPRAAQALMLGIRARAVLQGRLTPSLDDVHALIIPVFIHRMALNFSARAAGHTLISIIERLKAGYLN